MFVNEFVPCFECRAFEFVIVVIESACGVVGEFHKIEIPAYYQVDIVRDVEEVVEVACAVVDDIFSCGEIDVEKSEGEEVVRVLVFIFEFEALCMACGEVGVKIFVGDVVEVPVFGGDHYESASFVVGWIVVKCLPTWEAGVEGVVDPNLVEFGLL